MDKKLSRNDPCPCGSGKKYKQCCWGKELPTSDVKKPLFERSISPGGTSTGGSSALKKTFTAKVLSGAQKPSQPLPDPLEKTFSKTLSKIRTDEAPPAPPSDELPPQELPHDYKKWDPKKG